MAANAEALASTAIFAEYVWIGGDSSSGKDLRSKTRVLQKRPNTIGEFPQWNFDGSSTGQAPGDDSEVILRPVAVFADPFMGGEHCIVLCDCARPDGTPVDTNTRVSCAVSMAQCAEQEPWFGIEQEYTLFERGGRHPLGWPPGGFPKAQGSYYCGAGVENAFGRDVKDAHALACLRAGIKLAGTNGEVMPSQWEYQVGPCAGIEAGDHLIMSRYIMLRVCEKMGVFCTFDPKPIEGDWNGAGCHTNFSTREMRAPETGWQSVMSAIEALKTTHGEHMRVYGSGNERRMTGQHETASYDTFSYGVADRGASIRIPRSTEADKCGYIEDRRPASNMDPYVVTDALVRSTLLLPSA